MEKRVWFMPRVEVEQFEMSQYIAACWKINCNVPNGYGYKDNDNSGTYNSGDTLLTPSRRGEPSIVWGCGTWHIGVESDNGPVANAMWHPSRGGSDYEVFFWRDGTGDTDVHFSKVEDAEWETNPNAS